MIEALELQTDEIDGLRPWHKPGIEQITVSLDTGSLTGSAVDGNNGDVFFSDVRLKSDVAGIGNALGAVLGLDTRHGPEGARSGSRVAKPRPYATLIPVLVEAIKEQQRTISHLQDEIEAIRRKATGEWEQS